MQIRLNLQSVSGNPIELRKNYNDILQGFVYRFLDRPFAAWLHEEGFKYEKRKFKHFTFSPILERALYNKAKGIFLFPQSISLIISSPVDSILEQISKNTVMSDSLFLGSNRLIQTSLEILPRPAINSKKIRINALSPIEVHSTLFTGDNKKKTYYYSPSEKEFSVLVNKNMKKKWTSLFQKDCPFNLSIHPVKSRFLREIVAEFKGFIVKGWKGHFYLEGEPEILRFALDAGLSSRNSQGFGCIELVCPNCRKKPSQLQKQKNYPTVNPPSIQESEC